MYDASLIPPVLDPITFSRLQEMQSHEYSAFLMIQNPNKNNNTAIQ